MDNLLEAHRSKKLAQAKLLLDLELKTRERLKEVDESTAWIEWKVHSAPSFSNALI